MSIQFYISWYSRESAHGHPSGQQTQHLPLALVHGRLLSEPLLLIYVHFALSFNEMPAAVLMHRRAIPRIPSLCEPVLRLHNSIYCLPSPPVSPHVRAAITYQQYMDLRARGHFFVMDTTGCYCATVRSILPAATDDDRLMIFLLAVFRCHELPTSSRLLDIVLRSVWSQCYVPT